MSEQKCFYDYTNKCDCSEDDKCSCTFPDNMPHNFDCPEHDKDRVLEKLKHSATSVCDEKINRESFRATFCKNSSRISSAEVRK